EVLGDVDRRARERRPRGTAWPRGPTTNSWPGKRSAELLVRGDQVLRARRQLAVDGDLLEREGPGQRDLLRVRAGERRLDLGGNARAELLGGVEADLLQERREQPAAHAPRLAERARELGRAPVEAAVDVDLLVGGGPVTAVLLRGPVDGRFHRGEDLAGQLP